MVSDGERHLAQGDVRAASQAFEDAATMAHMADIELGILRTQMQAGLYRQALTFAAHTAGIHLDHVEGAAFYAWLLSLGAQQVVADQTLAAAERREPGHAMLKAVRQQLASGEMRPAGPLLQAPARLAPLATGASVHGQARVVASALLLADGTHALAPLHALPQGGGALWLRNGLGQTVSASLAREATGAAQAVHVALDASQAAPASGLVLLRLASPLPVAGGEQVPSRDAFAGSPMFAMDYPLDASGQAAWPVMRAGFLGMPTSGSSPPTQRLGVALPGRTDSPHGGPVYDHGGRLIGVAVGAGQLLPLSVLRAEFGERFGVMSPVPRPSQIGADEVYERAMKTTLQVLAAQP